MAPLRDRLLSNSPDPLKSSILRESGMGWSPSSGAAPPTADPSSITSPLRIAKRDTPTRPRGPVLARRSSSSYRHVHTNNLVSKSPFKSQIPTPSTPTSRPLPLQLPSRRVSGEKRPRPSSIHEQAENENNRPLALKRDRKQSKAYQELVQREPVTKSPFRNRQPAPAYENKPLPTISFAHEAPRSSSSSPTPFHMHVPPTINNNKLSPARSALASKRMHGPRLSGGTRREKRRVTFGKLCDVLEFEREEDLEDQDGFEYGENEDGDNYNQVQFECHDDPFSNHGPVHEKQDEHKEEDASNGSFQLLDTDLNPIPSLLSDPDTSITGIVDEMFANANSVPFLTADISSGSTTPPRIHDFPTDLETEDGVPFGRSHHIERFLQQHQQSSSSNVHQSPRISPLGSPLQNQSPSSYPYNLGLPTHASPLGPPATPPRRSPVVQHSTPPLGRPTHIERMRKAREEGRDDQELDNMDKLPVSPSPMKKSFNAQEDGLIPTFNPKGGRSTLLS